MRLIFDHPVFTVILVMVVAEGAAMVIRAWRGPRR
jgi:hypothetical protein